MTSRREISILKNDPAKGRGGAKAAADLSPNYLEVHRAEALLRVADEDFFSAEAAYEAAISLAPDRAPLRLWFGGFLSRHLGDQERALAH